MKVKLKNGDEVECSVSEYILLRKIDKEEKIPMVVFNNKNRWTKEEDKIIKKYKDSIEEIQKHLPNRNKGMICARIYRLKNRVKYQPYKKFNENEVNIIKKNYEKGINTLEKLLPNHNRRRIYDKIRSMRKKGEMK